MMIQVIVALVAVGGAIVFSIRKKIGAMFKKGQTKNEAIDTAASSATSEDGVIDMLADEAEKG
jgi:hypothetical protein